MPKRGQKMPDSAKRRISFFMKNRVVSLKTRKKLSQLRKGKKIWKVHPKGMLGKVAWNKGNHLLEKVICQKCHTEFEAPPSQKRKFCSNLCSVKIRKAEEATNWKGDKVGYAGLHVRVKNKLGRPSLCEHCGTTKAKKFEWANKSGLYKKDMSDWIRLCTKCHIIFDNLKKV